MGVKGLNPLLKRHAPDAFFTIPINHLTGKRIAIDANNWMYTNMATARKKVINRTDIFQQEPNSVEIRREWFLLAINFIMTWLSHNITPVFVFDGQHLPEKDETKAKRRDTRSAARIKIDALYAQLRNETLERPANIIDDLRKELRNYNYISAEDFELFKMVIRGIGIPCLEAAADGEQLCSMLCVDGKVAAVFSTDTDNLTYGCPLIVTGFGETYSYDEYGNRIYNLDCVRHDRVLAGLNVSHSFFVDLCIMCGCDFNTNMPGYAAIKSFGLLQKYGSIDKLPRDLNTQCLKHVRCREIFAYVSSDSLITKNSNDNGEEESPKLDYEGLKIIRQENAGPLDINKGAISIARDYLEMAGVSGQIEKIITAYQHVKLAQDGYVENLQLGPPPKYIPPMQSVILNINRQPSRFMTLKVVA
jgi:5'-3' exonuclease